MADPEQVNATVLITGARGYLGGRITQHLAAVPGLSLRVAHVDGKSIDLTSSAQLRRACTDVECIVHLAAANENLCLRDPVQGLEVNGLGTLRLLRAAIEAKVRRFIYFSTAHVYGSPLVGDIHELTIPRPLHPYAISHHTAEEFVLAAHDRGEITGLVLRLSNGVGAPVRAEVDRWTLVVNDLCRQAVTTKRLELKTSGLQRRDFIAMEDVVRAVEHFIRLKQSACLDGLFNLGGEQVLSIAEIAELVAGRSERILGYKPPIIRPSPAAGEHSQPLIYRIDKLKATGFSLQGQIEKEIDGTLEFCREAFVARALR